MVEAAQSKVSESLPVPRVALLSEEESLKRGRETGIDDYLAKMHLFRVLLQHPQVAQELNATIMALVGAGKVLEDRLRELIIMRVSWLASCDYEWSQHWMASLYFGLTDTELASVRDWREATCFSDAERTVLAAADDVLACGVVAAQTWKALAEHFPEDREKIEIVTCIANWNMFAQIIRSLDIPLEGGLQSWPPDGCSPNDSQAGSSATD